MSKPLDIDCLTDHERSLVAAYERTRRAYGEFRRLFPEALQSVYLIDQRLGVLGPCEVPTWPHEDELVAESCLFLDHHDAREALLSHIQEHGPIAARDGVWKISAYDGQSLHFRRDGAPSAYALAGRAPCN